MYEIRSKSNFLFFVGFLVDNLLELFKLIFVRDRVANRVGKIDGLVYY